jgi:hypothetical protein
MFNIVWGLIQKCPQFGESDQNDCLAKLKKHSKLFEILTSFLDKDSESPSLARLSLKGTFKLEQGLLEAILENFTNELKYEFALKACKDDEELPIEVISLLTQL